MTAISPVLIATVLRVGSIVCRSMTFGAFCENVPSYFRKLWIADVMKKAAYPSA
jgi:hypothetical protein